MYGQYVGQEKTYPRWTFEGVGRRPGEVCCVRLSEHFLHSLSIFPGPTLSPRT